MVFVNSTQHFEQLYLLLQNLDTKEMKFSSMCVSFNLAAHLLENLNLRLLHKSAHYSPGLVKDFRAYGLQSASHGDRCGDLNVRHNTYRTHK